MKNVLFKTFSTILALAMMLSAFSLTVFADTTMYETVKDNVPIWSDASSSSTKLGYIDYEGTIVIADYSKINSSYNLWYHLTDNTWVYSGNVRMHSHQAIMCGLPSINFEQSDSYQHIVVSQSSEMCSCGQVMDYEVYRTSEAHNFDSNEFCPDCGYQKIHVHEAIMCGLPTITLEQLNSDSHTIISQSPEMCSCGYVMGYETYNTTEAHNFDSNEFCPDCGYQKIHVHEAVMCGTITNSYECMDLYEHIIISQTPDMCVCGYVLEYLISESTEPHNFNADNVCIDCGYVGHTHTLNTTEVSNVEYELSDKNTHIVIEDMMELCSCGSIINQKLLRTNAQHEFDSNDECVCGYKKETPTHTHTAMLCGEIVYSYSQKDSKVHYQTETIPYLCECGSLISVETKHTEEKHTFVDGYCEQCNIEKIVDVLDVDASQIIDQTVKGNYSEDVTLSGIIGEILTGEIPIIGTAADIRDVYYDFQHKEGFVQTVIDLSAFIPFAGGVIKYSDELGSITKHWDEIAAGTKKLFKSQELLEIHYSKHGQEIANVMRKTDYSINDYLSDANYIIANGTYTSELNGYVRFIGGNKYGFVGLDRTTGEITTFHIKTVSELEKKAPSLGIKK